MRHIVRFSLISLAALFADAYVLVGTSATGPIRAADLRSGSFAKPAGTRSIPNFRDSPGDQAATEATTDRNKALPLKPPDALGNKIMGTHPVIHGTWSNFAEGHAARKQNKAFIHAKWNIPPWAAKGDILSVAIVCAEPRGKISVSQRQWRAAQLKPDSPETVSPAKHLFYEGGRNHAQNAK